MFQPARWKYRWSIGITIVAQIIYYKEHRDLTQRTTEWNYIIDNDITATIVECVMKK